LLNFRSFILPMAFALTAWPAPATHGQPDPAASEFFTTLDAQFVNAGKAYKYALTLKVNKPVNENRPWFVQVDYENPSNPSAHLIQSGTLSISQGSILFYSPAFPKLHNNKTYSVLFKVYSDQEMKQLITTHAMKVHVDITDPMMSIMMAPNNEKPQQPRPFQE
jgi:hypothetical protein